MNTLPDDPNISILPLELAVCAVIVLVALSLLLASCAGYKYEPTVSYTDKEGNTTSASVVIKVPRNSNK